MSYPSVRIEGTILSGELLAKLDRGDFIGQRPVDFGFDSAGKLKEEIVRAWTAAQAFYTAFQHKLETVKEGAAATSETRNQWIIPLLGLLGYADLEFQSQSELVGDKPFRLSHQLRSHGNFRVHIVGARESLDKKPVVGSGPRVSPHAHLQEYLNLTEHLYGIVTNGKLLRLLRDSTRLIKLSYVEFDLDRIFSEELFADFAVLYRLLHVTRLPRSPEKAPDSLLERYHQDALESGARIRDGLSFAVEQVLQELGSGFLARNEKLQAACLDKSVTARDVHYALLRLIYRLLLLMVAEERGLLFGEKTTERQRRLYFDHYSIARLRRLAERRQLVDGTKFDLWRGLRSTFRLFETEGPGAPLGLTGLGGQLFSAAALGPLQETELDNGTLLSALEKLSYFRPKDGEQKMRVNYGALATEEFGSVYERLLELHPIIQCVAGTFQFSFKQAAGNERKTSGSYYTPSSLVECLLDSALDPVLEERLKNFAKLGYKTADQAVLALKVCDPACGSGHFLIAAAQRIARRLALLRSKGDEPSVGDLRHTLREVISHCIYGVDINPMSVELCKVALWLEAMEAGKPLSFLDHHIRCGNSLLGATPALIAKGIPDEAFTAIEGDDKQACSALRKLNARERAGFGELFAVEDRAAFERLQRAAVTVENLPDDSVHAVEQKSAAFDKLLHDCDFEKATALANFWCAAFVIRKRMAGEASTFNQQTKAVTVSPLALEQAGLFGETFTAPTTKQKKSGKPAVTASPLAEAVGITSGHLRNFAKGSALPDGLMKEVRQLADQYHFFHWHLAFPEVFNQGGFSAILGNPPWEHTELKEKEFFAERRPEIANAPNDAVRKRLIESLRSEAPMLHDEFRDALRQADGESHMIRNSGLYPFCGRGRINLYAVFAERMRSVLGSTGRVGAVLPSGIATDDTTKFFFGDVVERRSLVFLFDFENRLGLFPAVDSRMKFCLFTAGNGSHPITDAAEFVFFAHSTDDLRNPQRRFALSADDIARLNPNTRTCPTFRTRRDAELTKAIYARLPVFLREQPPEENPWNVRFKQGLFNMATDSELFRTQIQLEKEGWRLEGNVFGFKGAEYQPLYEAKMTAPFDHRAANVVLSETALVRQGQSDVLDHNAHKDPSRLPLPRYWVKKEEVLEAMGEEQSNFLLGFTDVTSPTNERTMLATILPVVGVGHTKPLIFCTCDPSLMACLASNLNSFAFDYCARQKVGGIHFTYFYLKQLPVLTPSTYANSCGWVVGKQHKDWLLPRVLELAYTAWDLEAFARDCGWSGPPFRWDEDRRFQLRCELDAAFFHLYGLDRSDTEYILGTFPIVKRKDEEKFGTFRTKDRILEIYDALAECQRSKTTFQPKLAPVPASFRSTHPPRLPKVTRTELDSADKFLLTFINAFLKQTHDEATFDLLDAVFHLLRHRDKHAAEFDAALGSDAVRWFSDFNDTLPNKEFVPFLKRLEADGWITADRVTGMLRITGKFPVVSFDSWRNYDVSAALRVIAQRPEIIKLVITQPDAALSAREFEIRKTA